MNDLHKYPPIPPIPNHLLPHQHMECRVHNTSDSSRATRAVQQEGAADKRISRSDYWIFPANHGAVRKPLPLPTTPLCPASSHTLSSHRVLCVVLPHIYVDRPLHPALFSSPEVVQYQFASTLWLRHCRSLHWTKSLRTISMVTCTLWSTALCTI
jgi:hypothetical protein